MKVRRSRLTRNHVYSVGGMWAWRVMDGAQCVASGHAPSRGEARRRAAVHSLAYRDDLEREDGERRRGGDTLCWQTSGRNPSNAARANKREGAPATTTVIACGSAGELEAGPLKGQRASLVGPRNPVRVRTATSSATSWRGSRHAGNAMSAPEAEGGADGSCINSTSQVCHA